MGHESGYAPVQGTELYYERAGTGEPVLLLHTGNGNATIWDGQFEELAVDHTVVRYDLRGFGRSGYPADPFLAARDLAGLLDHLGIEAAHVIGPSLGGRIAVDFSLLYPDRVRSLLLAAPVSRDHDWSEAVVGARMAEEEAFLSGDFETAMEHMMRTWVVGPRRRAQDLDGALIERIRATQLLAYQVRLRTARRAGAEPDEEELDRPATDRLAEIAVPTLVLVGGQDQPDAIEVGEQLADNIRGARLRRVEDVGHMITMERPGEFLHTARAFLETVIR